jgi:hypothetical protein
VAKERLAMGISYYPFLIPLLSAHFICDFLIQTEEDVNRKKEIIILVKHGMILGVVSYLLLGVVAAWDIVVGIVLSHAILDFLKARSKKGELLKFFADQVGHISIILLFSYLASSYKYGTHVSLWSVLLGRNFYWMLTFIVGAFVVVHAGSFVVEMLFESIKPLSNLDGSKEQLVSSGGGRNPISSNTGIGIKDGGRVIGYLERALIYIFIMVNQPSGIGFLIAAKSILRFGELTEPTRRMQAEYIIIGTFASFLFGIGISYLTAVMLRSF